MTHRDRNNKICVTKWMHNFKETVATQQWEELKNYWKEIHSSIQRN